MEKVEGEQKFFGTEKPEKQSSTNKENLKGVVPLTYHQQHATKPEEKQEQ